MVYRMWKFKKLKIHKTLNGRGEKCYMMTNCSNLKDMESKSETE